MANSKRKCKHCSQFKSAKDGVKTPSAWFCCHSCAVEFSIYGRYVRKRKRQGVRQNAIGSAGWRLSRLVTG